jgi:DNA (cytosine-5)-methyltransferase 1
MQCDSGAAVYEFFAGGGLVRAGLGPAWTVTFANDIDAAKARAYRAAYPGGPFHEGDIWALSAGDLPGRAALAWASFPCQDLSLAGARGGLEAPRSGAFFGFWRLMEQLAADRRSPSLIALENVVGLFSSRGGGDLAIICDRLAQAGYWIGALEIDAALFVPQSRPRAFVIASASAPPAHLSAPGPQAPFHSPALIAAVNQLPQPTRARWVWWRLEAPPKRNTQLEQMVDLSDTAGWSAPAKTAALIGLMHPRHQALLAQLQAGRGRHVGALFRRIRIEDGVRRQRAEPRFDGLAGCLRTPAGGSSRQTLIVVDRGAVKTRLISPVEAARLMGAPEDYPLPAGTTAALKLFGDGVAAPVVRWLSAHLLEPLLQGQDATAEAA